MQLSSAKQELEEELKHSRGELEACREQLEVNQLELLKTKVYSRTMDKRNKVCAVLDCEFVDYGVCSPMWSSG